MPNFQFVLDNATGDYFMWASHDDYWYPTFIEKNLNKLISNEKALGSISNVVFIDKEGKKKPSSADKEIRGTRIERLRKFLVCPSDNSRMYSLFKISSIKDFLKYKRFFHAVDWYVTLTILLQGELLNVNEVLMCRYKQEPDYYAKRFKQDNKGYITFGLPLIPLTINIIKRIPVHYTILLAKKIYNLNRSHYNFYQKVLNSK
jgi:hypothetical protein